MCVVIVARVVATSSNAFTTSTITTQSRTYAVSNRSLSPGLSAHFTWIWMKWINDWQCCICKEHDWVTCSWKVQRIVTRSIWKMLGPFATTSRLTPIHQMSLAVLLRAACASMSTTTTTKRDRGDRYGPMEWVRWECLLTYLENDMAKFH